MSRSGASRLRARRDDRRRLKAMSRVTNYPAALAGMPRIPAARREVGLLPGGPAGTEHRQRVLPEPRGIGGDRCRAAASGQQGRRGDRRRRGVVVPDPAGIPRITQMGAEMARSEATCAIGRSSHAGGAGGSNSTDGAGAPRAARPPGRTWRSQHRFTCPWKAYPRPPAPRANPSVGPAHPAAAYTRRCAGLGR